MIAIVPAARASDAVALAQSRGLTAWQLGEVRTATSTGDQAARNAVDGAVVMTGNYAEAAADWR